MKPYRYDAKGQLIAAGKSTFPYDTAGNPQHNNASYDPKNHRLLEDGLYTYRYDDNGNLTAKQNRESTESTTYHWNTFGQLIKVRTSTQTLRYSYDALGRRVSKQTESVAEPGQRGVTELSRSTHHYLYDGQHIVAILNKDKQLLATIAHHPSQVDTPLSITNHSTNQTYYYHRDHQGSIIALSNEAGEIVESFIYDGHYGKILNHYTTEETMNPYGYTGREIDLPDLYYYRARYYDPGMQRFISTDPIEWESEDYHWYRYVGNDPVNFVDPTGLAWWDTNTSMSSEDAKAAIKNTKSGYGKMFDESGQNIGEKGVDILSKESCKKYNAIVDIVGKKKANMMYPCKTEKIKQKTPSELAIESAQKAKNKNAHKEYCDCMDFAKKYPDLESPKICESGAIIGDNQGAILDKNCSH